MILRKKTFSQDYYDYDNYSILDTVAEKAFCEGYEYAQKMFLRTDVVARDANSLPNIENKVINNVNPTYFKDRNLLNKVPYGPYDPSPLYNSKTPKEFIGKNSRVLGQDFKHMDPYYDGLSKGWNGDKLQNLKKGQALTRDNWQNSDLSKNIEDFTGKRNELAKKIRAARANGGKVNPELVNQMHSLGRGGEGYNNFLRGMVGKKSLGKRIASVFR